jgi:hypothetical protein
LAILAAGVSPHAIIANRYQLEKHSSRKLQLLAKKLIPLHQEMGPVQAGDWLGSHEEAGQTFQQYLRSQPVTITSERNQLEQEAEYYGKAWDSID